jgi:hypothetical protein
MRREAEMSNSTVALSPYPSGTTSAYTAFLPLIEDSIAFDSTYSASSSWRKFIRQSPEQRQIESTTMTPIASSEGMTTESFFVPRPTLTLQELLNGPLFQVAGIFEIDEPGWVDKIDEYIAETYL